MTIKWSERIPTNKKDYAVKIKLEFEEMNNCCGMWVLMEHDLTFVRWTRGLNNRHMWLPCYIVGPRYEKRFNSALPKVREWFERKLYDLVNGSGPVVAIQVVDFSKKIQCASDAIYEKKWSLYDFLRRIKQNKSSPLLVRWGPSYYNCNSGNYIKVGFVSEKL